MFDDFEQGELSLECKADRRPQNQEVHTISRSSLRLDRVHTIRLLLRDLIQRFDPRTRSLTHLLCNNNC
jgi:hypothetical protein